MTDSARNTLGPWLELSAAADYLGVHFSTLRRWADEGQLPYIRTPGGRRRFQKSDLDAFLSSLHHGPEPFSTALQKLEHPIALSRAGHAGVRDEPWYSRLDERQRTLMRAEGQQMMAVLMQYATRSSGGEAFLEQGQRLAAEYGRMFHTVGLSLVETVRAFALVRRSISDSVYEAGALAGPPDAETWRVYDRTNHFLDTMLVTIVEVFDQARSQNTLE